MHIYNIIIIFTALTIFQLNTIVKNGHFFYTPNTKSTTKKSYLILSIRNITKNIFYFSQLTKKENLHPPNKPHPE